MTNRIVNAEVVGVYPNRVRINVENLSNFKLKNESLRVGSYLRIPSDDDQCAMMAIIENFSIESSDVGTRRYLIDAMPLGIVQDGQFVRGGDSIALPPKEAEPARIEEVASIYRNWVVSENSFTFACLVTNPTVRVAVDGNKFFNKHIAVVGSTGSGKSHTVCRIVQTAVNTKSGSFALNNSRILIFDLHSEYRTAFPEAVHLGVEGLVLPYWLLTGEELEDLFLDTDAHDHNQRFAFREAVIASKRGHFTGSDEERARIHLDSALFFSLEDVLKEIKEKNEERLPAARGGGDKAGPNYGKFTNFVNRLEARLNDGRFDFLLGKKCREATFVETLRNLLGYNPDGASNVTVVDLSGVPFEVLSVTVALATRLMFQYGYLYKKARYAKNSSETLNNDVPVLLVYEEAHKYVPNSGMAKFRAARTAIERVAKEGRKYGVTLMLSSQRPAEISETIFSQCNNFVVMRLTNSTDQSYVKRLLPDTLGGMIEALPSLRAGEALLLGEGVILPSVVCVDRCEDGRHPSSADIPYWELWQEEWKDLDLDAIERELL